MEQNDQGGQVPQMAVASEKKKNYDKESRLPSLTQLEPGIFSIMTVKQQRTTNWAVEVL